MEYVKIRLTAAQKAEIGVTDDGLDAAFIEFPDALVERIPDSFGVRIWIWGVGTGTPGVGSDTGTGPYGTGPSGTLPGDTGTSATAGITGTGTGPSGTWLPVTPTTPTPTTPTSTTKNPVYNLKCCTGDPTRSFICRAQDEGNTYSEACNYEGDFSECTGILGLCSYVRGTDHTRCASPGHPYGRPDWRYNLAWSSCHS